MPSDLSRIAVTLATRIFVPEPAAASFRLSAVCRALSKHDAAVTVLTANIPRQGPPRETVPAAVRVKRFPVLRDKQGYLRGYLPYLSFDIPLLFRLLVQPREDVVLVEPPPTTGAVVRVATALRRVPYVWYAADIWSDAAETGGSPRPVVQVLRMIERFAVRGAAGVIAATPGFEERARELGAANVVCVPNGVDTAIYHPQVPPLSSDELRALGITGPYLLYAGAASEWQDASVFAEAAQELASLVPGAQVVFTGHGTQWKQIADIAERVNREVGRTVVVQLKQRPPQDVARLMVGCAGALVSLAPGHGFGLAYPTKVLSALSAGVPVLYAGAGPATTDVLATNGIVVDHAIGAVADAMAKMFARRQEVSPQALHNWAQAYRSIEASAAAAARFILQCARRR